MAADFKSLGKNEQGALIAGGLALVFSFIGNFINVDIKGSPIGLSGEGGVSSAWTGFFGTVGILLMIAAAVVLALKAFSADTLPDGVPWNLAAFGAAALGLVLSILRGFTAGEDIPGVSYGPGWSAFVVWIAGAALTYFAFLLFKESGEKMPDLNQKDTPPAA